MARKASTTNTYFLVVPEDPQESTEYFCKTPEEAVDQYIKDYEPAYAEKVRVFTPQDGVAFVLEIEEVMITKVVRANKTGEML